MPDDPWKRPETITDPRIVEHAATLYRFYIDAGDESDSALRKSAQIAIRKLFRNSAMNMEHPRTAERFGGDYVKLQALILESVR